MRFLTEFRVSLKSLAVAILLLLRPAVAPEIVNRFLLARDGEDASKVQTRKSVARDLLANDGKTEDIPVCQVLVDSLLECFGKTIQIGSGRRHLDKRGRKPVL